MSRARILSIAAATVATAAGFLIVTPPAVAATCTQFGFDGPYEMVGSNGWRVKFNATGTTPRPSASVVFDDGGKVDGTVIDGGIQGRTLTLSIVWGDKPNNVWDFYGTVSDDGHVGNGSQQLRNIPSDYSGEVVASWTSVTPLKCLDAPAQAGTDPGSAPPPSAPTPPQPVKCPQGSPVPEVPAGQTCPAPKDAVRVTFTRAAFQWTVNVTNSADIGGNCTYNATANNGGPGASNNFTISPKGTASFQVPAPAPLTVYHVVTSCTGTYDGQQVEFGHDEQDVSL